MALIHVLAGLLGAFLLLTGLAAVFDPATVREGYADTSTSAGPGGLALALNERGWRLAGAALSLVGTGLVYWAVV